MRILSSHNRMLTATVLGVALWTVLSPCLAFVVPPSKLTAQRHAWPSALYSTTERVEKEIAVSKQDLMGKDPSPKGISTPTLPPKRGASKPAFVEKKTVSANKDLGKEIPLGVVLQRAMDTTEDAWLHLCRQGYEQGTVTLTPEEDAMRKTIVVLGSGWAAHALMKVADCRKLRIVVVSPTNHFVFTPFLASAAAGTVEYRSMTEHVRDANPMIHDYIQGAAVGVDVKKKTVTVELNKLQSHTDDLETLEVPYDHLVVSVGCTVHDFNIAGVKEHALKLKTIEDAKKIRTAVTECFELASRPDVEGTDPEAVQERIRRATFLIAGGGPSGVELAGEISDLIKDVTRKNGAYPNLAGSTRVIVVEGGPTLVPPFQEHMRKEALASLQEQGVEVHLNTFVTEVADDYVKLSA